jgi:hypothetical protein
LSRITNATHSVGLFPLAVVRSATAIARQPRLAAFSSYFRDPGLATSNYQFRRSDPVFDLLRIRLQYDYSAAAVFFFSKYPTVLHSELLGFMSMRTPAISRVGFRFH